MGSMNILIRISILRHTVYHGKVVRAQNYHQTRGRPKRRRIPSQGESMPLKNKCGQCGELSNHNKKTCWKMREGR